MESGIQAHIRSLTPQTGLLAARSDHARSERDPSRHGADRPATAGRMILRTLAARVAMLGAIACLLSMATGCTASRYLFQAGRGQLDITFRARPIDDAIRDPRT